MPARLLKRLRDSSDADQAGKKGKQARAGQDCPVCFANVFDPKCNIVQCTKCEMWVHASKCTDLSALDLIDKSKTDVFKCKICLIELELEADKMDVAEAPAAAGATPGVTPSNDSMLGRILSEILAVKREVFELRKLPSLVAKLSEENAELRKTVHRLSNSTAAPNAAARGRTPTITTQGRIQTQQRSKPTPLCDPSTPRSGGIRLPRSSTKFLDGYITPRKSYASVVSGRPQQVNSRVPPRRILRVTEQQGEPRNTKLPRKNVRIYNQRAFISLHDTDVDAKGLHTYLKSNNLNVISVTSLKQKFEHYRSFVVECCESVYENLFDPALWDKGTVVKEFIGSPRQGTIESCFPLAG